MGRQFLCGVANVYGYNPSTGDLVFQSKTMLDDSVDVTVANTEIRAGQGDALQLVYFHGSAMKVNLTESQFSLNFIGATIGSALSTGKNLWTEETVTLGAGGTGNVVGTPLMQPDITGSTVYGWVTDKTGTITKVTFATKAFTLAGGTSGDQVTVRYFANNAAAQYIQVNSNIIPSVVRLVMDAQLFSTDGGVSASTLIGKAQVEIPRCQLDGAAKLSMTSSGVSNTPVTAMALAYNDTVTNSSYYATIAQIINSSNWYDQVYAIAATTDPITVSTATTTFQLDLRAIPTIGSAFKPPYTDITFASSDATKATVSAGGLVTKVAVGSANINFTITGKNTVAGSVACTVS